MISPDTRLLQRGFSDSHPEILDPVVRRDKAATIAAIIVEEAGRGLSSARCLDLGAAGGFVCAELAAKVRFIAGCDIDSAAIDSARSRAPRARFLLGDGGRLPFRANSFDVIICNNVYEHAPSAETLVSELARVLRDDGFVYFGAVNRLALIESDHGIPLLSWLPVSFSDRVVKLLGNPGGYYERPRTLWGLESLLAGFSLNDISTKVALDGERYGFLPPASVRALIRRIPASFLEWMRPLLPSYRFILRKRLGRNGGCP